MSLIQLIINEHKVISKYAKLVNLLVLNLKSKKEINRDDISFIVEFYRIYIDQHHHEIEEIVFPIIMKSNPIGTEGIIELIINEHDMGGNFIDQISRLIQNGDEFFSQSLDQFTSLLHRFEFSMTSHIEKENKFLQDLVTKRVDQISTAELNEEVENLEIMNIDEAKKEFLELRIDELLIFYQAPIYQ